MAEDNGQNGAIDLSGLGSFDFAPSWTAGDKVVAKTGRGGGFRDQEEERNPREGRAPRRFDGPKSSGDRPFNRDRKQGKPFNRDGKGGRPFGGNRPDGKRGFVKREFVKPLEAEIRVLPGQKELGGIIRKIQTGFAAYPLKQIAWFFLDHPEACHVKVTPKDPQIKFHVCKACGFSCFSEEALDAHILSAHLGDYYTAEEMDVEPPSGQFGCVVKCGVTGELIGPPNLHGYNSKVREMAQRVGMDEDAYRARLVTVRDQESVEAWRQGATKKTFYRLKVAEAAAKPEAEEGSSLESEAIAVPALERDQAEAEFRRNIAPQLKSVSKSSDMTLDQALKSTDLPYLFAVRDAIAKERRFPASLFFALRGAFHHRKLVFFRANDPRGQEFVSAVKPAPLDTEHAIPELGAVVKFVEEHPLCSVADVPAEMKGHLGWLAEKGHVVQYFNGLLALPEAHPKFRNQPAKKDASAEAAPAAEATAVEAPVAEASAAEVPVAEAPAVEAPAAVEAAPTEDMNAESAAEEDKKEEISNEAADKLAE